MDKKDYPKNWRNILWREWRNTDDEEYAEQLLSLLTHRLPFNWKAAFFMMVWGMVWGAIVGLLVVGLNSIFGNSFSQPTFGETSLVKSIPGIGLLGGAFGILMTPLLNKRFGWAGLFFRLNIGIIVALVALFLGLSITAAIIWGCLASILGVSLASSVKNSNSENFIKISDLLRKYLNQRSTLLEYLLPCKRRLWYFWWRDRPKITKVEAALRQVRKARPKVGMTWSQSLRRLEYPHEYPASLDEFIADLESNRWLDRFIARHRLFDYGGEAVQPLLSIINRKPDLQPEGIHILKNIAWETSAQLSTQTSHLVCPHCLTRCHTHKIDIPWQPRITFYGCRTCQQSREFLKCPQGIVAVLDTGWTETHRLQNGLLRVNWSAQQRLFDFDRVEIIQATDEEVERFAMQVGNDTDLARQPCYAHMHCLIAPDCRLSENSLRILRNFFGQAERQEIVQVETEIVEDTELAAAENMGYEESDVHWQDAG